MFVYPKPRCRIGLHDWFEGIPAGLRDLAQCRRAKTQSRLRDVPFGRRDAPAVAERGDLVRVPRKDDRAAIRPGVQQRLKQLAAYETRHAGKE